MKNKTLSVIIPNYNKGNYISILIDSILKQTRLPEEIIVVDDCSTDNSRVILEEVAKQNQIIKVFYLEQNKGVQYARNFGASKASCEFLTFIDSDDFYYEETKLENEMKYAKGNRLVCSRFYFFDNVSGKISSPNYESKSFKFYLRHQKYCLIQHKYIPFIPYAYIISKKAFLNVGGYDFKFNLFEDLDILIKFKLKRLKFLYLKTYGRAYRINDNETEHLSDVDRNKVSLANQEIKNRYSHKIRFISLYMRLLKKCGLFMEKEEIINETKSN